MADYISTLTGVQMDASLLDMAEHTSEAYAIGERNGVPVDSSDVTYHNNARYYAQQAQSIAPASVTEAVRWDIAQTALTEANKAQARENIAAGSSNYNLVDNSWFSVNSRNWASTASGTLAYTVDRWAKGTKGSATKLTNGVQLATDSGAEIWFTQKMQTDVLSQLVGKSVTLTVYASNASGTWRLGALGNAARTTFGNGYTSTTFTVSSSSNNEINISSVVANSSINIIAVKLELGAYSTLAQDSPPDYGEELTRCIYSKADPADTYANNGFGRTNPNLLDNPWWGSGEVINQRGVTSNFSGYNIDRWKTAGTGSYALGADGITITGNTQAYMTQLCDTLAKWTGRTFTGSVMLSDGTIYSGTGTFNGTNAAVFYNVNNLLFYIEPTNGLVRFGVSVSGSLTKTIRAVKLELGSVSTLANDTPPEYGTELLKCQRYFFRINGGYHPFGVGDAVTTTSVRIFVPTPVPMRVLSAVNVTVTMNGNVTMRPHGSSGVSATAVACDSINSNGVCLSFTIGTAITQYSIVLGVLAGSNNPIDISCDL